MSDTGAETNDGSLTITEIVDADVAQIISLWEAAGLTRPWNDPERDIAFARAATDSTVLVGRQNGAITACAMAGHDGHRGTVYYLGVSPAAQGHGLGRQMMDAVEGWLRARGVWKINLMVREDNTAVAGFYDALGYTREPRAVFSRVIEQEDARTSAQSSPKSEN
ncbi:MAG: GNAT family acetyltransferase [Pseudomonadota bacterium]